MAFVINAATFAVYAFWILQRALMSYKICIKYAVCIVYCGSTSEQVFVLSFGMDFRETPAYLGS